MSDDLDVYGMDPDKTLPSGGIDPRAWFDEEYRAHLLAEKAAEYVAEVVARAVKDGDARARSQGIQGLKAFLGTPDHLDQTLEVFCYGRTLEHRKAAGALLSRWLEAQQ